MSARPNVVERFWAKVDKTGDCWECTAGTRSIGYGQLYVGGPFRMMDAHRFSAMLHFGMFDLRLYVCHTCDNPKCVRPDHLYLGTPSDNWRDTLERVRKPIQSCTKAGHPYTDANTVWAKQSDRPPRRYCRTCVNARQRAKYAQRKGAA